MAIDFPDSPTNGDTFTVGDTTWVYQNSVWNILTSSAAYSVCTSSSRPSAPGEGRMIYETDTNLVYIYNGSTWSQNNVAPVGMLSPFAGSSAPDGWLLCHGQAVSQTTYAALFALIGSTYDATSPGAGNFRVPDLRGRVIAGVDNMGGSDAGRLSWQNTLGTVGPSSISTDGGAQTHTLTTSEMPAHTHTEVTPLLNVSVSAGSGFLATNGTLQSPNTGSTGGGGAHNNMQPTMLLNYIIKY
jgi:microcystin-dependent protein